MMSRFLAVLAVVALVSGANAASAPQRLSSADQRELMGFVEHIAHDIGHDIHKAVDHIESEVDKIAQDVSSDVRDLEELVGHGISDLVHDVGAGFERIAQEVGSAVDDVWKDAVNGLQFIMKTYTKFEAGLLKINEKLFGAKLGYILDKIENAAIDQIPVVGTVMKVVADGVEITQQVKNAKACWKAHNWECVAGAVTSAVTQVATSVTGNLADGSSILKGITEGLGIADKVVTVGVDLEADYKAVKLVVGEFKDHDLTVADAVQLVNSLGSSIDSMASVIESILPSDWSVAVHGLKIAVADVNVVVKSVDEADQIYLDGVQISNYIAQMKTCLDTHDYLCVGKEIAGMIAEVGRGVATFEGDLTTKYRSEAMENLAQALVTVGTDASTVMSVADDMKADAKQFEQALQYFQTPVTVARVKQGLALLSQTLSQWAGQVAQLDPMLHGKLLAVVDSLQHDATVVASDVNRGVEVIASGQQVWADLQQAAADYHAHNWQAFAHDIANVCNAIATGIQEQTDSMSAIVATLLEVSKDANQVGDVIGDVKQDYAGMRAALAAFDSNPLSADDMERGLTGLSTVFSDLSSQLTQVSSFLPSKLQTTAHFLSQLAESGAEVLTKGDELVVSGVQVINDVKALSVDAKAHSWEALAQGISKLATDVVHAVEEQTQNMKTFVATLLDVSTDAQEVASVIGAVKNDIVSIQNVVDYFQAPHTVARFQDGVAGVSHLFSTLSSQLSHVSSDLSGDLATAAAKLAQGAQILANDANEVDRVMVAGQNLFADFLALDQCTDNIYPCLAAKIKAIVNALKQDQSLGQVW